MSGILFASDLDNTLMFSYKYRTDSDICVEYLDGKAQSFCTQTSLELLARVCWEAQFVPVTTRSIAQYQRIAWPCAPRYAVTTNGGILLVDGAIEPTWYAQTQALVAPWRDALLDLQNRLPEAPMLRRHRMVDDLYLFAVCDDAASAETGRRFFVGKTPLRIETSGRKVYFFPPSLHKGEAIRRLNALFSPRTTICAGDSVIDIPMLRAADLAIVPHAELLERSGLRIAPSNTRFSDFVLKTVLQECQSSDKS